MSALQDCRWNDGNGIEDLKMYGVMPLRVALDDLQTESEKAGSLTTEAGRKLYQLHVMFDEILSTIGRKLDEFLGEMGRA